jgi:8-oxo-dGTP diphosphatase
MDITRLPYKIAVLAYLHDEAGRTLLLHRAKMPNQGLYSPVGGKVEVKVGESPTAAAIREIQEETGLDIPPERLHLSGIVSETAYQCETHWLIFLYDVIGPVKIEPHEMDEGTLDWHTDAEMDQLPMPETDQKIIWPVRKAHAGGFFMVHIDCQGDELVHRVEQSWPAAEKSGVG